CRVKMKLLAFLCMSVLLAHIHLSVAGKIKLFKAFKKTTKTKTNLDAKTKHSILEKAKNPTSNKGSYPKQPEGSYPQYPGSQPQYPARGYPQNPNQHGGYPQYPNQHGGYPQYPNQHGGYPQYPNQHGGYPQYPNQHGGYPQYPNQHGGYSNPGSYPGYPARGYPQYPNQHGGSPYHGSYPQYPQYPAGHFPAPGYGGGYGNYPGSYINHNPNNRILSPHYGGSFGFGGYGGGGGSPFSSSARSRGLSREGGHPKQPKQSNQGGYPGGYPRQQSGSYYNPYPGMGSPYSNRGYPGGYINANPNNKILSPRYGGSFGYGGYGSRGGSPFSQSVQGMGLFPNSKSKGFGRSAVMAAGGGAVVGMALGYGLGRFPRPDFQFHNPQQEYYYNHYMHRKYGTRSTDTNDYSRDYSFKTPSGSYDNFMDDCVKRIDLSAESQKPPSKPISRTPSEASSPLTNNTTNATTPASPSPQESSSAEDDDTVSIVEIGYPALIEQLKARKCLERYMV
uniref:Prion protein, related sequence 3 n=1 Tax=Poecilia formosa TaxID=48698 RepID=A0A087XZD2_POEFO